ncbi:hypothetical protein [uncultured Hoeflea sp.]|uniref:hypothetical protein n=1 Tax=uncultured Hoeflea sp. TaxID=538666 RepID=UPI0030ED4365|tara:strand:- start:33881 stop:34237 length:357 start_codon:yes stop_codon:yes gene_type:complete
MTRIRGSEDCGNSPKNSLVEKIAIALETGQVEAGDFSEGVVWERGQVDVVNGRQAVTEALASNHKPDSLTIEHAISHGKTGAASGHVTFANGETRRFCHVLEFTSVKANCLSMIWSYA